MLEVAVSATLRCKITTRLQPPKGVLQLMLTLFHGKSEDEPPAPVPTCVAGIPPAAVWSADTVSKSLFIFP